MFGEGVSAHLNLLIGALNIRSLERWPPYAQSVDNDSQGPYIDFVRMTASVF